jgi:hypothetical protein
MRSFDRAIKLLGGNHKASDVISIKLKSDSCWCFKHKPVLWEEINKFLGSQGPIQNEGDLLLKIDGESYVLQCHETGPEICMLVTASLSLVTAVITLIVTMVNLFKAECKHSDLKVIKRKIVKNEIFEEVIVELHVDDRLKDSSQKDILKQSLKKVLE